MVSAFYTGFGAPHIAHADLTISHWAGIEDRYPEAAERDGHASVHEDAPGDAVPARPPSAESRREHTDGFEAVLN